MLVANGKYTQQIIWNDDLNRRITACIIVMYMEERET